MQVNIRLKLDGASKPHASRHYKFATALLRQGIDSTSKSICIESDAITHCTIVTQVNLSVGELRRSNLWHLEWQILGEALVRILTVSTGLVFVTSVVLLGRGSQSDA